MVRAPVDDAALDAYRERFALALTNFGMQRMVSRVLAALIVAEKPALTMTELGAQLGASAGAMSGALRILSTVGLVERVPAPGSRRYHYRVSDSAWYEAMMHKNTELMEVMRRTAADGVAAAGGETTVAGRRLADMRDFYAFIQEEMPALMARWQDRRNTRSATGRVLSG